MKIDRCNICGKPDHFFFYVQGQDVCARCYDEHKTKPSSQPCTWCGRNSCPDIAARGWCYGQRAKRGPEARPLIKVTRPDDG